MSARSGIEWTDATWNVVIGCDKVSPGCDHCYAIRTAHRMSANPNPKIATAYAGTELDGEWTGQINLIHDRLNLPLTWTKPKRIFVNAQSDLFHSDVPDEFIAEVFAAMKIAHQHTFQILTKRPSRMRSLLNNPEFETLFGEALTRRGFKPCMDLDLPLKNVWLGVSVENQHWADIRIPVLLDTPAAVRFLSCEPLLGPLSLTHYLDPERACTCGIPAMEGAGQHALRCPLWGRQVEIGWVIAGGESGPGARPMHPEWVRSLRDQCTDAGVAFHFKQWGEWRHAAESDDIDVERAMREAGTYDELQRFPIESLWPDGTHSLDAVPELGICASVQRVGKKRAGRELDGRTWDEYPEAVNR